ncbi:helix-turn-helix domain-containing protein [Pontibacter sp. G13]|uniref:helix-turn-helix domain-containing protein n=1 Tax=Pontibacter sp. G13 TaxID=3074898 RepID=UPI00288B0CDA|nr:helix-turn-helix domain-containing protein [Pontibacter sp. G13]WNJ17961.1 helix-turn-helix domain-containing protein [Pontibacter sp. G13]
MSQFSIDPTIISPVPSKEEKRVATRFLEELGAFMRDADSSSFEIAILKDGKSMKVPFSKITLELFREILKMTSAGKQVSIEPVSDFLTTSQAADILGCSRPHLIKLLEEGAIPFHKIGTHRRVSHRELSNYLAAKRQERDQALEEMTKLGEDLGLYDT